MEIKSLRPSSELVINRIIAGRINDKLRYGIVDGSYPLFDDLGIQKNLMGDIKRNQRNRQS